MLSGSHGSTNLYKPLIGPDLQALVGPRRREAGHDVRDR